MEVFLADSVSQPREESGSHLSLPKSSQISAYIWTFGNTPNIFCHANRTGKENIVFIFYLLQGNSLNSRKQKQKINYRKVLFNINIKIIGTILHNFTLEKFRFSVPI